DVRLEPDGRIAQISQVPGLGALVHHRILHFHKISNVRARANVRPRTQPRKGPDRSASSEPAGMNCGMSFDDHIVAKLCVVKNTAGSNCAARSNTRLAQQMHARFDYRVSSG